MTTYIEWFNQLTHVRKILESNRRIQRLDADIAFAEAAGVTKEDSWFLYTIEELRERRQRWCDVRDKLVWEWEEVVLS